MEADRGEDLGLVTERIDNTIQFKEKVENNKILRIATDEEIRTLPAKLIEENKALVFIRNKVQNFGYDMEVHDAEFQFDCHKLTFYYKADRRIDFRELVATLFAQFKTRIWMQRTNDTRDKIEPYVEEMKRVEPSVEVFSSTENERLKQAKGNLKAKVLCSPTVCQKKQNTRRSRASSYDTHPTLSTASELDQYDYDYDDDNDDVTIQSNSFDMDFPSLAQLSIESRANNNEIPSQLLSVSKPSSHTSFQSPPAYSSPSMKPTTAALIYDKAVMKDDRHCELQPAGILHLNNDLVDKYFETHIKENESDPINTPVELQDFDFNDVFNSDYDVFTQWSKEILNGY